MSDKKSSAADEHSEQNIPLSEQAVEAESAAVINAEHKSPERGREHSAHNETKNEQAAEQLAAEKSVKKGALIVVALILTTLVYYLLADRFSPYTTQAYVKGYVIGVAPKVGGLVTKVLVKNNQEVQAGQVLFEIDSSQYEITLNKSRSDLNSARNQVDAGNAAVNSARANLRSAQANEIKAKQDLNRLSRLHKKDPGTISVRRIEVSQATLQQAQAAVTAAEAQIQQAIEQKGGDDDASNAILTSAQSAVAKAELDLHNTKVTAATRGVITDLSTDVGNYANAGNPVMTLLAMHDVWISAEYTENNLGHIHIGSPVEILFDAMPGEVFTGQVRSIGVGVNSGGGQSPGTLPSIDNDRDWLRQSQRFPVIINFDIDQQAELRQQLRVGGQASVITYTDGHGVMRVLGGWYIRLMSWFSYAY